MPPTACPRVLVLGIAPVRREGGQGITIANLFAGWEEGNLAQIHFGGAAPDPGFCANSHAMPPEAFPADWILRKALGRAVRVDDPLTRKIGAIGPSAQAIPSFRVRLHLALRALNDLAPVRLPSSTRQWIRAYRPEVIYTCLGNVRMVRLALAVSREAGGVPVVPHFMDDWPSTLYADGRLAGLPRRGFQGLLRQLLRHVPLGFCIGSHMASEYESRYGLPFHGFMNCVEDGLFARGDEDRAPGPLVWTYVGGLHLNRWKSLLMLALSIDRRGDRLEIFAPAPDVEAHGPSFAGLSGVRLGSLAPREVMDPMKASDVLLHVESFTPEEAVFTRLSVSTKLAQYLACGKTVLGFGPSHLASMKVILEAASGLVVDGETQRDVDAAVERIAIDPALRSACGRNGLAYASEHFRQSVVCGRFRARLAEAAGTPPYLPGGIR